MAARDMVVLGRITEPYGLQGWVKLHAFCDDFFDFADLPQWWLAEDAESTQWQAFGLQDVRAHGKGLIARFEGVTDRNASEAIEGRFIAVPRESLPKTANGEFYWADLIGLEVVNLQDEELGVVSSLMSSGAHEVLCVRDERVAGGERLLPFVAQVVKEVALTEGRIRVDWGQDW